MKLWLKACLILVISLSVVIGAFSAVKLLTANDNASENELTDVSVSEMSKKQSGIINVLVLGVDNDGLRTDTIMLVSYDMDKSMVNTLSIPRDTRVYFNRDYHKINAAHAVGGTSLSVDVVENLTGIPIDYYVEFTTTAFRDIIDALGGVQFEVDRDMKYSDPVQGLKIDLKAGNQLLDGAKAEQLVRFRKYPEGDIMRVKTQQKFFKELVSQKLNPAIVKDLPKLYRALKDNIKTDISSADILKYVPNLLELSSQNLQMYSLPGDYNDKDYGTSYWICDKTKTKDMVLNVFGYAEGKAVLKSDVPENQDGT